jgi:glutamyl-tRNA reductase
MTGLDWRKAPIGLREALSFTRSRVVELDRLLRAAEGVEGCVLLSTCNRTELYLSCASGAEPEPGALLCAAAGLPYAPFAGAFVTRTGEEAARHLMEVAGGLRSQIWGEDQILTQVKGAAAAAREAGTADGVLEILFRNAAAAGKEIKTATGRWAACPPLCSTGWGAPSPSPCAPTATGRPWCPPGAPWPPMRSATPP